jgi:hypothetical protein
VLFLGFSSYWGRIPQPLPEARPLAMNYAQQSLDRKNTYLQENPKDSRTSTTIGIGFAGGPVGPIYTEKSGQPVGTHYLLPFEIVSVHLLVVLIGAAYLARTKLHRGGKA